MLHETLSDSYLDEVFGDIYPKVDTLKDGTEVTIKLLESWDKEELMEFFLQIPARDRMFLMDDVTDESVIDGWCANVDLSRVIPLVVKLEQGDYRESFTASSQAGLDEAHGTGSDCSAS